ncbi:hypothetical protein D6745_00895 [Candidatus Woesearchaeota archaeon]|nr:MAG: hypothetical protein D6745_00895 [Candidatus Woesearchaeota archaeon]
MMTTNRWLQRGLAVMLCIAIFLFAAAIAQESPSGQLTLELKRNLKGARYNTVYFPNNTQVKTVKQLAEANPKILVVNYYNPELKRHIGYINIHGGRGRNFVLKPDTEYMISVKNSTNITLALK